jgi:hypothetical protein
MTDQAQWTYRGGIVMFDGATAQASYKGESSPLYRRSPKLPQPSKAAAGWIDAKVAAEQARAAAPGRSPHPSHPRCRKILRP